MIGNNTLNINEATMREAMQQYLDKIMPGAGVTVVSVEKGDTNGYSKMFTVETTAPEKPATKAPLEKEAV